jgi:cytochrome c-type biogenesis protein CcmH
MKTMIAFWAICGLMILLALWFVLPALFQPHENEQQDEQRAANLIVYQDQYQELETDLRNGLLSEDQYKEEKEGLERRLLDDVKSSKTFSKSATRGINRRLAYGVALAIPVGAIAFYFVVGNPKGLSAAATRSSAPAAADQTGGAMSQQQIAANVEKLAQRLAQNPNDAQGWTMLARSYLMMERYAEAADAYTHVTTINSNDADAWADFAEAQAMANGQNLIGKPTEALNRALQIDPKHQKALDLAGSAAFQAGDYQRAIGYWQKLLLQLPAGSPELKTISEQIAKAKELAGAKGSR